MPKRFPLILICEVVYITYINLVEISLVFLVIQKTEFGEFTVPVNNTLVCHVSFVFLTVYLPILLLKFRLASCDKISWLNEIK